METKKEIEKKYLLSEIPQNLPAGAAIKQGYLITESGEMRLRAKSNHYFLTVKGDGTISRDEWETEIPEWVFQTLWPKTEGRRVEKTRHAIPYLGLVLELDIYAGRLAGLITLECEFPDAEAAAAFCLPDWAKPAIDVTADKAYKNKALAVKGLPTA